MVPIDNLPIKYVQSNLTCLSIGKLMQCSYMLTDLHLVLNKPLDLFVAIVIT